VRASGRLRRWPLVLLILVSVAALAVAHSPLMAIETVEILGAEHTDVQGVVDGLGVGTGALLLWINTSAIEDAVTREPWVADVRVDRIWPDRVVVEVLEHEPAVWIEGVLGWMLVGRDGTVLDRSDAPGSGLLRAALAFPDRYPGDRSVDPLWNEVVAMALVLSDDIGGTLTLEMRGAEMWTIVFGHDVRLGHPIDLADKGRTLRAMLAEEVPDGAIIDVSSPLRPALVPTESEAEVETP
jgi:cell division protein FtsQ